VDFIIEFDIWVFGCEAEEFVFVVVSITF